MPPIILHHLAMNAVVFAVCRYQSELSELQPLKVAAAEVVSLRGRLSAATATAASLAAACDDIRRAKDEATAQLAAAQQKCRQLQADGSIGGAIVKVRQAVVQMMTLI